MLSNLKSLELHGYKTFASRTQFEFPGVITCVVGPNGSGKSNIADSIRWVLGEQSYSLLRGRKTEDMIFSGSEQRPRAGMASATIFFDNTSGWLPIDFREVAITRRAYRDGTNEYLLNGNRVRLKEIGELLAQSGLAERTYTIIGQGLVDAALSLKPEERRRFFEEAAGIGLYRHRKEESLNRLENTRRNLERVNDILNELGPRLVSLEKQAKKAIEYERIKADLRIYLRDWYGYHWHSTQQNWLHAREVLRVQETRQQQARQRLEEIETDLQNQRKLLTEERISLNGWHSQSSELHNRREKLSRDLAVLDERQRAFANQEVEFEREWVRLEEELAARQERQLTLLQEEVRLKEELEQARQSAGNARRELEKRQQERFQVEQKLRDQRREQAALQSTQARDRAHIEELQGRLAILGTNLKSSNQAIEQDRNLQTKAEGDLKRAQAERSEFQLELEELQEQKIQWQLELEKLDAQRNKLIKERMQVETEHSRLKAQIEVILQAERSFSGLNQGARVVLDAARQGKVSQRLKPLSRYLDVPQELELAITAVLGEFLDGITYDSGDDLGPVLALLEVGEKGRAVLVPTRGNISLALPQLEDPDIVGIASEMVKPEPAIKTAIEVLLGNVLVVRTRQAAHRLAAGLPAGGRLVTLKGEVFWGNGVVIAGQEGRAGVISRPRQKREFEDKLNRVDQQIAQATNDITALEGEETVLRSRSQKQDQLIRSVNEKLAIVTQTVQKASLTLDQARSRIEWQAKQAAQNQTQAAQTGQEIKAGEERLHGTTSRIQDLQNEIQNLNRSLAELPLDELQRGVIDLDTMLAVTGRALKDNSARLEERRSEVLALKEQSHRLEQRSIELKAAIHALSNEKESLRTQEHELTRAIDTLQQLISPAEQELDRLEKQYSDVQTVQLSAQQTALGADRQANHATLEVSRLRESLEALQRRIEEDFGLVAFEYSAEVSGPTPLPLDGMVEQLPRVVQLPPGLEENINRQRALLRRMGAVNLEAQSEYQEVKSRFQFLTTQVEDLKKADADLRQVIEELDQLMRKEFLKTFDAVAAEFKGMFTRLFGGGSARLVMVDEDNPNESGIDIEARLPGRREQGLSLLSGGERSLTAVALVFSLLKVSPTPFCVLDEVDAMLDEANVGRFRDLLLELSQKTQFIVITHNRNTVQAADVIYGVTMGRDSASQVISLRLDEIGDEMVR